MASAPQNQLPILYNDLMPLSSVDHADYRVRTLEKVPFLGDLPFLGRLFRRDIVSDSKSELLIFLTPRIMDTQAISVSR